jgi:PAS domain S-box-containing protein
MGAGQELFARRKDGSQFPAEIELSFIKNKDELLVMSFVVDITERKATAAALEQQRSFLRNVIDVSPSLIFVKDYNSRFILANPMVAKMLNTRVEDLIGKTDADFSPSQEEVEDFLEADRRVITSGEALFIEEPITSFTGETRWFQTTKVPVASGDGKSRYILGVSTDITARREAEEALRQAFEKERELGELKSRFVSMASHEFRTPLATILALTETLSAYRHKLSDDQIETRFGKVREQVNHLKDIMEDVLQLARLQTRRSEFNPVRIDLDALCRSVLDEFQSRSDITHKLVYSCDTALHNVYLDKKLMRQIINNLVSNAIKYSASDKTVTVNLEAAGNTVILKVTDEGIGIPEADLKHLFEPFHRADNVGAIAGTGLGLVITKESVELHGGTITVDSVVDVGTTITVQIPVTARKEENHGEGTGY